MVSRAGYYYGISFKRHQGVTQGDPLSPTIFNMVVDVLIHHWVTLVAGEEAGPDGFVWVVQWLVAFFYTDDIFLSLTSPYCLQAALDILMWLF